MKTLIIGAKGMLGHELARVFADYKPILWTRDEIDITNQTQVDEKITTLSPQLIINAAAYTNVDECETNETLARNINGQAVLYLAETAAKAGATLVHYSTDYVFDGDKKEGYGEDDEPNPINAYGRSKLVGEQAIQASGLKNWYIIRTAWLYGKNGKNFVEKILSLAESGKPLKVIDDQIGSPTYAVDLAQATRELVEDKKPTGIYHRTNSGQTTWYGFAKEIFTVFNKNVDLSPCTTEEYPLPAKRPAWSVLQSTKLEPMRDWKESLCAYAQERQQ
ncbi:MAG: dTDP-4-dehydrorhamnose reductase [Candidatus Komeilibacteria bacterium]|nr:dTDP-4-dehydrorhamnose reductase [Candidatus Komeilibacteria bacterium]